MGFRTLGYTQVHSVNHGFRGFLITGAKDYIGYVVENSQATTETPSLANYCDSCCPHNFPWIDVAALPLRSINPVGKMEPTGKIIMLRMFLSSSGKVI